VRATDTGLPADARAALDQVVRAGRRAWPDLDLPADAFARYVLERMPDAAAAPSLLESVHASDLYVAFGCARGDERAIAAFERHFMARVPDFLAARRERGANAEEVQQAVRARVLVAGDRERPRIADYTGRGPLLAWLRVTTARVALNLRAARPRETSLPSEVAGGGADPEMTYLKQHYRRDFETAFEATLAGLAPRDATLLKLHFVSGMSAMAIAKSMRVSERTVHRWLAEARQRILDETHRRLADGLRLSESQIPALAELLRSQADVSVARILSARARRKRS
jgi:RNA polymerase sigma-70 factor (ECF subfamily)